MSIFLLGSTNVVFIYFKHRVRMTETLGETVHISLRTWRSCGWWSQAVSFVRVNRFCVPLRSGKPQEEKESDLLR